MLALRKMQPAPGVELSEVDWLPGAPADGEVEIAVHAAGICGSDLHVVQWDPAYASLSKNLPVTIGHEFAGRVVACGAGVAAVSPGDRVVCWPTLTCGDCAACRSGNAAFCSNRSIVGLHRDGGFAQRVRVPERACIAIPDSLPTDRAALVEPLSIAVNAVDQGDPGPDELVVVLGPGPIGTAAAWVAARRGAKVLLVGLRDTARLAIARDMGIADTADLVDTDLGAAVATSFDGAAPDLVIEATGAAASVVDGLDVLRPGGALVVAGIHKTPAEIDLTRFVREKKRLFGAHDTTARAFAEALSHLDTHGTVFDRLVTHRLALSDGPRAFEIAGDRAAMKILLMPEELRDPEGARI